MGLASRTGDFTWGGGLFKNKEEDRMRRRIGMMLAAILALACLVGCSEGGLSDRDFMIYDENGNVTKKMEDTAEGYHIMATKEGEYTSRKIGVGSTEEELKEAYGDIDPVRL